MDTCLYCESSPCECSGKPEEKKTRKSKAKIPVKIRKIKADSTIEAIRMLEFNKMLHPQELKKYNSELTRKKPSGKLRNKEV